MRPVRTLVAVLAILTLGLLAGCTVRGAEAAPKPSTAPSITPTPVASPSPTATPSPTPSTTSDPVSVELTSATAGVVPWSGPVVLEARNGTITGVTVSDAAQDAVSGSLSTDKTRWESKARLLPDDTYTAHVALTGPAGDRTQKVTFSTTKATKILTMSATPGPGAVVGIGEPIAVSFNRPVADRKVVEQHMKVTTSRGAITGSWYWFSDTLAHFRPKTYWPAHTAVHVAVDLTNLYVGDGVWGDRMHNWSFEIGDSHIAYVNLKKDTFTLDINGKTVGTWPTAGGMPGWETYGGTYIVLEKLPEVTMTSCSIGLTCNKKSPQYYSLHVKYATRVTWSGTFVHAAPWDSELGKKNTSHGCIHLSTDNAKYFYDLAQKGDVVVATGSNRPPKYDDPGMMDWNYSWGSWLAGSALHQG